MRNAPHDTVSDKLFWAGVLTLAVLVRVWNLGRYPLGASEADVAYRAWQALRGHNPDPGLGGWLTPGTALLFFVSAPTAFWARLGPALVGGLLPLVARAWQPIGGRRWARALALGWALDPALVAASRLAWGPVVGATWTAAAWVAYRRGRASWAALLALVALASGPAAGWALLTLLAVALWEPRPRAGRVGLAWVGWVGVGLLWMTAGLTYPAGLGGWAGGLMAWWRGWHAADGVPRVAAVFYIGPVLLWALWGAYGSRLRRDVPFTGVTWTAAGLIMGIWLVYPARQAADLAWVTFALWPWAAAAWDKAPWGRWTAAWGGWLLAAGWSVLLVFAALTLWSTDGGLAPSWLRWSMVVAAGLTAILMATLTMGWFGAPALRHGVILTFLAATTLWAGMSLHHAHRAAANDELWQRDAVAADVQQFEAALTWWGNRLTRGAAQDLTGVVLVDHPTLQWLQAARFPGLKSAPGLMPDEHPWVIVTQVGFDPGEGYRGQRYHLREALQWPSARAWVQWFVYRRVAHEPTRDVILWVRNDAFTATASP